MESTDDRARRHRKRAVFDGVAGLYDEVRAGYPDEIVREVVEVAGVGAGDPVLEIGCGTGQLTAQLVACAFDLTAIDPAPSMIERARSRLGDTVRWVVTTFEDFAAPDGAYRLVASATAFHWVDPDVGWEKAARLLATGGWLALLGTTEVYDDPFGSALRDLWVRYSDRGGERPTSATPADLLARTGLFHPARFRTVTHPRTLSAEHILKLEQTRATTAAYPPAKRDRFLGDLRELLRGTAVNVTQTSSLTLAQRR